MRVHECHVVEETGRPAAGRDQDILELRDLVQHSAFHVAESLLAFFRENGGHRLMVAALNIMVEIDESEAGPFRQQASDRCLAGSHITY